MSLKRGSGNLFVPAKLWEITSSFWWKLDCETKFSSNPDPKWVSPANPEEFANLILLFCYMKPELPKLYSNFSFFIPCISSSMS